MHRSLLQQKQALQQLLADVDFALDPLGHTRKAEAESKRAAEAAAVAAANAAAAGAGATAGGAATANSEKNDADSPLHNQLSAVATVAAALASQEPYAVSPDVVDLFIAGLPRAPDEVLTPGATLPQGYLLYGVDEACACNGCNIAKMANVQLMSTPDRGLFQLPAGTFQTTSSAPAQPPPAPPGEAPSAPSDAVGTQPPQVAVSLPAMVPADVARAQTAASAAKASSDA